MNAKKIAATVVGIGLSLAGGWAALGATLDALDAGNSTAVGQQSPVAATPESIMPLADPAPQVETVIVDVPVPAAAGPDSVPPAFAADAPADGGYAPAPAVAADIGPAPSASPSTGGSDDGYEGYDDQPGEDTHADEDDPSATDDHANEDTHADEDD